MKLHYLFLALVLIGLATASATMAGGCEPAGGSAQGVPVQELAATPQAGEADPYDEKAVEAAPRRPAVIYTRDNAPATPPPDELSLEDSVLQYGITWTFQRPVRVGQF